jgi:ubiquinone/menaquinone biosynthesis C-methylase UbiE
LRTRIEFSAGIAALVFGLWVSELAGQPALSAGEFVSSIYGMVSFTGGTVPDWEKLRACFLEQAVVVLRTSPTATTTFSRDEFVNDFVEFYERGFAIDGKPVVPKETGFSERVVRMKSWEYGDMAHVLVLFEAQITRSGAPAQQGVDSWLLARRDGQWRVAAVTNEVASPIRPVPADLQAAASEAGAPAPQSGGQSSTLQGAEQKVEAAEQEHVESLYALARLHAQLGHRDEAYRFLSRAIGAGFNDRGRLVTDETFKAFRDEELFRSQARKAWANGYIGLLERSNRENVQKSPEIMKALAFKPGERVADIGAGSGYFTIPVSRAVGSGGVVWALDTAPEMLEYLDFRVKAQKIENIRLRRVASDDPQIEPSSVETILMIDTIHYVKDRVAYATKLVPALAPGGRLIIIDYIPKPMSARPWGPPPEQQVSRAQMDADMVAAGFKVVNAYDFLPEQYFVVYSPAGR